MPKISDIEKVFDTLFPKSLSCGWDNDGLQICADRDREVTRVITCLDVTFTVIEKAIECGAELIVSHHPLIFSPLKSINEDTLSGQKALLMLQNGISLLSLHTRFDAADGGLNDSLARLCGIELDKSVSLSEEEPQIGAIGFLAERLSPPELAARIAAAVDSDVRLYSAELGIRKVGICCGAGKDLIPEAIRLGADAFLTGDVSYHAALDAMEAGITVIDFGHNASEKMSAEIFREHLSKYFPDLFVRSFFEDLGGEIVPKPE